MINHLFIKEHHLVALMLFFTKKGTYLFLNNCLTLNYVGGEKYKDNSGGGDCKGECITKKEQLVFNYSIKTHQYHCVRKSTF